MFVSCRQDGRLGRLFINPLTKNKSPTPPPMLLRLSLVLFFLGITLCYYAPIIIMDKLSFSFIHAF